MSYNLIVLLSYSIFIAAVVLLIRYRKLGRAFLPFLLFILVGSLNEVLSTLLVNAGMYTTVNNNIYILLEALLLSWQFRRWITDGTGNRILRVLPVIIFMGWLLELWMVGIQGDFVYFSLGYSFVMVVLAVQVITKLSTSRTADPAKRPVFIISLAVAVYFTCRIILDSSWYLSAGLSKDFRWAMFEMMAVINCICNIIYALAILWIPSKQNYSGLSY